MLRKIGGKMFSEIEKEYKKGLQEKRFLAFYWPRAVISVVVAVILRLVLARWRWWIYGGAVLWLLILVGYFFVRDFRRASQKLEMPADAKGIVGKIKFYIETDDFERREKLVEDLARHGVQTKEELKLTLDYFETRLPSNSKPNLLSWILTTAITLSSITIVAYDEEMGTIDAKKFLAVFCATLVAALLVMVPFVIAKLVTVSISKSRNKVEMVLVEDLAYIYVNFEKYQEGLGARD